MDKTEVLVRMGVAPAEVLDVEDSPAGPIVTTHDRQRYILIDEASPDADGKHGVMYLVAPHERYVGTFPVYAQPGAVPTDPEAPSEETEETEEPTKVGDVDGDGVPDGNAAEIRDWVGEDRARAESALAAEQAREAPRTTLVAWLEAKVA